jgi:hypothetical protein
VRIDADAGREAAFAVVGGRLMLATSADLAAQALTLLAGGAGTAVTAEDWYSDATQAAGPRGEVRLVHNLQALIRTPHFRSYWIQENVADLRAYRAGVADLHRSPERLREQRVLLKVPGDQTREATQAAVGPLLARVPDDAGFYQLWAGPSTEQVVSLLQEKLLDPGPSAAFGPYNYAPPPPDGAESAGSDSALETRIDQAPPERSAETFDPTLLATLFDQSGVKSLLQLQSQRPGPDGALPAHDSCIFIELGRPAALEPFVQAVSASSAGLWTVSGLGASWEQEGQVFALEGLNPLYAWVGGSQVALANSAELLRAAIANRPSPVSPPETIFAAGFRHAREAGLYRTAMTRMEHLQNGPASDDPNREPNLFSENIASLSQTLDRLVEVRIERRDLGERIDETVVYERRP